MYRKTEGGRIKRFRTIWLPLFAHFGLSLLLAAMVAKKLDGYNALAYNWQSHHQPDGHYTLRVSDITTLLSAATTVINYFGNIWMAIIAWRCILILLQNDGLKINHVSQILSGFPPWPWKWRRPHGLEWPVLIVLLLIFPQAYIEPLFSGSVNWNFAIQFGPSYQINSGSPTASSSLWYWYLTQVTDRLKATRQAEGLASISWTGNDAQTVVGGTEGIFGGISCRHVMSSIVAPNSTVENAAVPCIEIHNITWPSEKVPNDIYGYTGEYNSNLSIVGETPFAYEHGGVAVLYSREQPLWDTPSTTTFNSTTAYASFPEATIYSGNMTVIVLLIRQEANGCNPVAGSSLGNDNPFGTTGYINEQFGDNVFSSWDNTQEDCFVYGTVYFTAGVVGAPSSTFISSQVVEYYPTVDFDDEEAVSSAIDNVANIIEPSIWTREALWLMPDVMTSLAVMNSSLLPTWMNLNNYTATLIRQAYFASWDMLHLAYEQNDTSMLTVFPAEDRLQASVSFPRLFAWLGITLLVPITGFVVAYLQHRYSQRGMVSDQVGILLTDSSGVVSKNLELSVLSSVADKDEEMGRIVLKQVQEGSAHFRLALISEG